ncbi:MAG: glutamine--fructose-6-phosphate transaminase (isomerizing) [Bacteriovoracaceae bacterium]|nr:glutamine--fructose-6-phosphate transaminase (isomerizing) [Bacteriovoracaceae bacterium]
MCGIVGHIGPSDSVEVVMEGLRRLEYRGYDSAGVTFIDESGTLKTYKKTGKIEKLTELLKDVDTHSMVSIGHTRWATHGGVTDFNSHPHAHEKLSMVHNGIIENADGIRDELMAKGYKFKSETDSEVFLMLVHDLNKTMSLKEAILKGFSTVTGNSAFVFISEEQKEIYAIKRAAPLVCGTHYTKSQAVVSSDPYALAGAADRIYFPEDGILCHLSAGNKELIKFYDSEGNPSEAYKSKKQDMQVDPSDKGDFEHYMLKEIYEQPGLIRALCQYYFTGEGSESLEAVANLKPSRFHITACGTAYYAGLVVRDFIESINRIPCSFELASEFRYRNPILEKNDIGLFISQSGETADTLAGQEECQGQKIKTISLVNVEGSSLFRACDHNLLIRAGVEIGVASTKAFTQMGLTGRLLAHALSGDLKNVEKQKIVADRFELLAVRIDKLLDEVDKIKAIAEEIYNQKGYFFTGRGKYFPVALEGALKLKEIAYVHAEGYAAGELKHGPIALIDEDMVNIALVGPELKDKTISNIQEIKARKGIIVGIGPSDSSLERISDYFLELNFEGLEELSPLYINVVNQLLSYYMAKFKGTDIDKPRNLAKSVTVE